MQTIGILGAANPCDPDFAPRVLREEKIWAMRLKYSGREILHQPVIDPCHRHFYSINIGMIDEPEPVGRPGDNMVLLHTLLIPTNDRVRDPVIGVRT